MRELRLHDRARRRWLFAGAAAALAPGALALWLLRAPPHAAPPPAPAPPSIDDGVVRQFAPHASTSPSRACRVAGGTCVGLEAGACARGTLADPARLPCGHPTLRCCLP